MTECTVNNIVPEFSGTKINDIGFYTSCLANKSQTYFMVVKPLIKPDLGNITDKKFNDYFQHDSYFYGVCTNADCLYSSVVKTIDPVFGAIKQNYKEAEAIHAPSFMAKQHKIDFWVVIFAIPMLAMFLFTIYSTVMSYIKKKTLIEKLRKTRPNAEKLVTDSARGGLANT